MKRRNYYEYEKSSIDKPVETKSKFDHSGDTISITNINQMEELALDYLSVKRGGTYYDAFEFSMRLIEVVKRQERMIQELNKNCIV